MIILAAGLVVGFGTGAFSLLSGDPLAVAYIVGAVMALLGWLSVVSLLKHVFLLVRRPQLRLSRDGIFLRHYKSGFRTFIFPCFQLEERRIARADFSRLPHGERPAASGGADLQEPGHRINRAADRVWLDDVSAWRGEAAKEILDYLQLTVQKPARESARVSEFLSLLFRQPKTFPGPRIRGFEVVAAVAASALCGLLLYLQFIKDPNVRDAIYAMAGTTVFVCAVGFPLQIRRMRAQHFIQLSASGIAVGPEERSARLIPWSSILLVRVHKGSASAPGTRLELRLANGDTFFFRDFLEAAQLAAVIDPPAEKVQAAWQLIAKGATAENAAREVGLR